MRLIKRAKRAQARKSRQRRRLAKMPPAFGARIWVTREELKAMLEPLAKPVTQE